MNTTQKSHSAIPIFTRHSPLLSCKAAIWAGSIASSANRSYIRAMPKMKLSVAHSLGAEEARKRIAGLVSDVRNQFGGKVTDLEESWAGNIGTFRFRVMGFAVTGRLEVQAAVILIEIDFPLAALPFKSRVENEILTHARELLA
jgi:putative polyhydroxyalkanoic acid system protein